MAHKKKIDTGEFSLQGLGFNLLASAAIFGCIDPLATNFNPLANSDDGSCCLISGCTDPAACNYDATVCFDDGSCESTSCAGCTDPIANNYDATATIDDGSCNYTPIIPGCTCDGGAGTGSAPANDCYSDGVAAFNYDPLATVDDGSCVACVLGCTDPTFVEYDSSATCDDGSCLTACTYGCMDDDYVEYDVAATCDDGSCLTLCIDGCTDPIFVEYWFDAIGNPISPPATCDDGSCLTNCVFGCMDPSFVEYNPLATCPDNTCITPCIVGCTDDSYVGYNALATCHDQSMCGALVYGGCTDVTACNYDPLANTSSSENWFYCNYGFSGCCQTCGPPLNTGIDGCCDSSAFNYDPLATCDSGQGSNCVAIVYGCTDSTALNYYAGANVDDGTCVYVAGCTDSTACNYDPLADFDDSSCTGLLGCMDSTACNYDASATCDDGSCYFNNCSCPAGQTHIPSSNFEEYLEYYTNDLSAGTLSLGYGDGGNPTLQALGWNSAGTNIGNQGTMTGTMGNGINNDGCVTTANIDQIKTLNIGPINAANTSPAFSIVNLQGIGDMTSLENVNIKGCNIQGGASLDHGSGSPKVVDFRMNTNLKWINIQDNSSQYFEILDVRNGTTQTYNNHSDLYFGHHTHSNACHDLKVIYVDDIWKAIQQISWGNWVFPYLGQQTNGPWQCGATTSANLQAQIDNGGVIENLSVPNGQCACKPGLVFHLRDSSYVIT